MCPTFAAGRQSEIPRSKKPKQYEESHEAYVAIWRRGKLLLRQCGDQERWAGLWDFPRFQLRSSVGVSEQLQEGVRRLCGVEITPGQHATTIRHGVTRFRITLDCYHADWRRGDKKAPELRWTSVEQLDGFPLTMTARKFSRMLRKC